MSSQRAVVTRLSGGSKYQLKALFAGCARDCAVALPSVLDNVDKLSSLYAAAAFVFVENDSKDDTKQLLKEWCDKKRTALLITLDGLLSMQPVRGLRLEHARRQYLAALKTYFSDYSHLIVLDCDQVNAGEIDLNAVQRAIEFLESDRSHAGVFSNQDGDYYDMWALRHRERCPGDIWEEVLDCMLALRISDREAFNRTFAKRTFSLPSTAGPLEVDSAFGGLGIYKVGCVLRNAGNYVGYKRKQILTMNGPHEVGWEVCEHVSFNFGFRQHNERLFILPYLVNAGHNYHVISPSVFRQFIFSLRFAAPRNFPTISIRRNDRCPCGSGKKLKHCHGALVGHA
jgi:hypothetical protein